MRVPAGALTGHIGVLPGASAISVGVASGWRQQNISSGAPPELENAHGETPTHQSGRRARRPSPPTRLMLRQKSSSGSTSEKHPPRLPTARSPGTTVGDSQSVKSTTTQTACADLNTHGNAPVGVRGVAGVVRASRARLPQVGSAGPVRAGAGLPRRRPGRLTRS